MKASEARQIAIDASLEEIEKVEAEIEKACREGRASIVVDLPFDLYAAVEAYFKVNGYRTSANGVGDTAYLTISWI